MIQPQSDRRMCVAGAEGKGYRVLVRLGGMFSANREHGIRFLYLTAGSVLQMGALSFVVYPYLSRRMSVDMFADLLLLMTTMNFYITVFGPPVTMAFYRRFGELGEEGRAVYTGALLKLMAGGLILLVLLHLPFYDVVARAWMLSLGRTDFLYALMYMVVLSLDAFLLSRAHFDFGFRLGFTSRAIFFLGSLLIIPIFLFFPENWMLSFSVAPLMSILFLMICLVREGKLRLTGRLPKQDCTRLGLDYLVLFFTGISSQLLMYSDRWILATFNVPKAQIAYYIIAVQASLLVSFPVDRMGELMMPYLGHMKDMDSLTRSQARKSLFALGVGLVYLVTIGVVIGYLFFKLYNPNFLEQGWQYFVIMLGGACLFTVYTFSRAYLFRFFPGPYLYGPFLLAAAVQIGATVLFLSAQRDAIGSAYGRLLGFMVISVLYFIVCQVRIFKIVLSPSHE